MVDAVPLVPPQATLLFDPGLQLWVLPRAEAAEAVLKHPACCLCESSLLVSTLSSIPAAGGACLTRGAPHREIEHMIAAVLEGVSQREVRDAVRRCSTHLLAPGETLQDEDALHAYTRLLPGHVLGTLLGATREPLDRLAERARRCGPAGDPQAPLGLAPSIAQELLNLMQTIARDDARRLPGLVGRLAGLTSRRPGVQLAQALLRLAQLFYLVHKASTTLLRHTVQALQAQPALRHGVVREPSLLAPLVREIRRRSPPLRHAFRVCGRDLTLAGQSLHAGDALVAVFERPEPTSARILAPDFLPDRKSAKVFAFGAEPFASPGQMLAETMAAEGSAAWLRADARLGALREATYPLASSASPAGAPTFS